MSGPQGRLIAAALTIGRRFGVGRRPWIYVPPPAGEGVAAPVALHSDGAREVYVVREKVTMASAAAPGSAVGADRWRLIAPDGTDVQAGGQVVDASGRLAFALMSLGDDQGYVTGIVDPAAPLADLATAPLSTYEEDSMQLIQGSTPTLMLLMLSSVDDKTAVTGATVTVQISKAGGAFAATANAAVEVGLGWYKVALAAAETSALGPLAVVATADDCNDFRDLYKVVSL